VKFDLCVCGLSRVKNRRGGSGVHSGNSSEAPRLGQDLRQGILKRTDQRDPSFVSVQVVVIVRNASGSISKFIIRSETPPLNCRRVPPETTGLPVCDLVDRICGNVVPPRKLDSRHAAVLTWSHRLTKIRPGSLPPDDSAMSLRSNGAINLSILRYPGRGHTTDCLDPAKRSATCVHEKRGVNWLSRG